MSWNNGGPGPWGNPPGSSGGDGDKKPTQGPWGNPGGGNKGPGGNDGKEQPEPERGPRRPGGPFGGGGGPFGGGGGPFGGGNAPDLDKIIAQAQSYIRGLMGGGSGRGRGGGSSVGGFPGGRGLTLLLLAVVAIWVVSGFYRVQPDEQGVVLRFGAYSYWTPPGLHWHVPWPVETVELPTVTRINRTEIGYRSTAGGNVESGRDIAGRDVLAESLMLTGDENIIDIDVAVFWRINDAAAFLFNAASPETLVRGVAESSMREVIGRTPIQPALGPLRGQIESDVLKQTQEILDRYKAGVEITQVQLQKVDPPAAVIESFRDVQRANTDAERMRNEAESYRNDIVPRGARRRGADRRRGARGQSRLGRPGNRPGTTVQQRVQGLSGCQGRDPSPHVPRYHGGCAGAFATTRRR